MTSALSGLGVPAADQTAYQMVYGMVLRQATLLAFMDTFRWLAFISAACAPLAFVFYYIRKAASIQVVGD